MKKRIYTIGIVFFIITISGIMFKMMHYPGAAIMMTLGFSGLLFIYFPFSLISSFKGKGEKALKPLYIVTYLTLLVIFTGMYFKIMHWPGAGMLLLIGIPFPFVVFLPVFLYVTGRIEKFSIYNTVYILLLLTIMSVFNATLAISVSKDRLDDSMYIASVYYKAADGVAEINHQAPGLSQDVVSSANLALKIIGEARDQLMRESMADLNALADDPYSIKSSDSRTLSTEIMLERYDPPLGTLLEESIKELLEVIKLSGNKDITPEIAVELLEFKTPDGAKSWNEAMFRGNWTSWSLVYLGILENSIILIRNELIAEAENDSRSR